MTEQDLKKICDYIRKQDEKIMQVCNAIRKRDERISALEKEVAALKANVKPVKPIVELTDEDKKKIEDIICTDNFNNEEAVGVIEWRNNIALIKYLPSQNLPSDKQLEFGRKMISQRSDVSELNRFLLMKIINANKELKLNRCQLQTVKVVIPKKTVEPQAIRCTIPSQMS